MFKQNTELPIRPDLMRCLEHSEHAVTIADQVRTKLKSEVDSGTVHSVDSIEKHMSILADRLVSYDHQDEINMIGSITLDSAYSTYIAVLNCRTVPFEQNLPCTDRNKHFGIARDFYLFGDTHLRWYALKESGETGTYSATKLGESNLGIEDPRLSLWYKRAVEGPKEGAWSMYTDDIYESVLLTFSKTFHATGNAIIPGPSGGGVVFVSVNAEKSCPGLL